MSRIKVIQKFKLVDDLGVTDKDTSLYISSGYNYAISVCSLKVDESTQEVFPWENLYNAYNERRFAIGDSVLPDYSTYNFSDYDTQVAFVSGCQSWIEDTIDGGRSFDDPRFVKTIDRDSIETGSNFTDPDIEWDWLKTESGLNALGFDRRQGGSTVGYGSLQTGDDVGNYLFDELNNVFEKLIYIQRRMKGEPESAENELKTAWFSFMTETSGDSYYAITRINTYDSYIDARDSLYARWDVYYSYTYSTIEVPDTTGALIAPLTTDLYLGAEADEWQRLVDFYTSFTLETGTPPDTGDEWNRRRLTGGTGLESGDSFFIQLGNGSTGKFRALIIPIDLFMEYDFTMIY